MMHQVQKLKVRRGVLVRLLIGGVTLAVSLTAYYSYQTARNVMLESLKKNALQEVEQGRDDIDRWLASLKVHVETLANADAVRSMNWSVAEPYLKSEVLRFNDAYAIAVGKPDGWRNVIGGKPANVKDRPYFQKAMAGQTNVSDPLISRATQIPTIAVAAPIRQTFDIQSSPSGEIHSLVRLDRIAQVVSNIQYGDNSYAFALSSNGSIIAHPNSGLSLTSGKAAARLTQSSDLHLAAIAQRMVKQQQGIELRPIGDTQKYIAYLPLKEANWSVALIIPRHNIELQLQALDRIALVIAGLAGSMILILWQVQASERSYLKKSNENLERRVTERTAELSATLEKLQQSQLRLIQSEKMSALGGLVAGVAHEINNPVNFIYGNVTHAHEHTKDLLKLIHLYQQYYPNPHPELHAWADEIDVEFLTADLPKILSSMRVGADRIRQIVLSLRNFSRLDQSEIKPVDIHEGIDSTLLILQHRIKETNDQVEVQIVKAYGDLPLVECYAGQLNQVFMNILSNALDALEERRAKHEALDLNTQQSSPRLAPTIHITTLIHNQDHVRIGIADNGTGIACELQQRIFDPFFTTKPVGKGTGMGMSISYQIVTEKHQGSLWCESNPAQGTTFWIEIPLVLSSS